MKQILMILGLMLVAQLCIAQASSYGTWRGIDSTFYEAHWDSVFVTTKDLQLVHIIASHDSGAGEIYIARNGDTTAALRKSLKQYETFTFPPLNNVKWLMIRAATTTVHGRIWIF